MLQVCANLKVGHDLPKTSCGNFPLMRCPRFYNKRFRFVLQISSFCSSHHLPGARFVVPACRGRPVSAAKSPQSVRSTASDLFSLLTFMSTCITSFHLFFGLPFFEQSILKFIDTDWLFTICHRDHVTKPTQMLFSQMFFHRREKYGGRGGSCPPGPSLPPWHLDLIINIWTK